MSGWKILRRLLAPVLAACLILPGCSCAREPWEEVPGSSGSDGPSDPANDPYPRPEPLLADMDTGELTLHFRTGADYFYRQQDGEWRFAFLKGVNMGLTQPTTDLNNPNVSYGTYMEWLGQIGALGMNTVKVFTVMNPHFYKALYDYNQAHADAPLYLLQGIWFNENYLYDIGDAYGEDGLIIESFQRAVRETLDVIHGNSDYTDYGEWSPAVYSYDVSPYVAGYILGLEWPADFVIQTNSHVGKSYRGRYLYTAEDAAPFEAFLAQIGDGLIAYETEQYAHQTPVAFLNWSTTDVIEHDNEPFPEEDAVSVNTEAIHSRGEYYAGLFAAIDIYPYYPEFLNHQEEYISYTDPSGRQNPYRAYLKDLIGRYSMPVVVAEFGVPTSRGVAHESVMGYNQGGMTEEQQGRAVAAMLADIAKEGYGGAMVFSWQDEWFKQTWNTIRFAPDDPAMRTPNRQSAEQSYGLLAYEPGLSPVCVVDGSPEDWADAQPVASFQGSSLYAKYDEGYLYLCLRLPEGGDWEKGPLYVPIRTVGLGSEISSQYGLTFSRPVDFLLVLNGKEGTRLLTDAYYDAFHYVYGVQKGAFSPAESYAVRGAGTYNPIYQFLSNEMVLPVTGETIPPQYTEAGKLIYGNADPDSGDYLSLADFCGNGNTVEIRLPWYLLGVLNGALGTAVGDLYAEGGMAYTRVEDISLGLGTADAPISMSPMGYTGLSRVTWHGRLKKSYGILQSFLAQFPF